MQMSYWDELFKWLVIWNLNEQLSHFHQLDDEPNCNDTNLGPENFSPLRPNYIEENHKVFLFKMEFRGGL